MKNDLKPCPFCGGEAAFHEHERVGVECIECGAGFACVYRDRDEAAEEWNRRVERTCRMVSAFDTDELDGIQENISFSPEDTLAYRCERCGFDFRYERGLYPSYCPNCGAKVVGND